jgi:FMN reductase
MADVGANGTAATAVALIYGTAAPHGRLFQALEAFAARLGAHGRVDCTVVDLAAAPAGEEAVAQIARAAAVVIFAPVYRAAAPGALKSLLDATPLEALESKPVLTVSMGASDHHYLANDVDLHPILAWFGALVLPGLYLTSRSFAEGALGEEAAEDLDAAAASVLDFTRRLAGFAVRPRPLAAGRSRPARAG